MADTRTTATGGSAGAEERRGRRAWLVACLGPTSSERDRRNSLVSAGLILAWAVSSVVPGMLGVADGEPTGVAMASAGLSFVLFLGAVAAMTRFIRQTDELNRVIQLRSIAVAFTAGMVTVVGADLLVGIGAVESVGLDWIVTVMLISGGLAQLAWTASFNR